MRMRWAWISVLVVVSVVAWGACGASGSSVVDARDISKAGGAPSVSRVTDLGDFGQIPRSGSLPRADSDGQFVVGELVLIEGDDFGKLPTVQIGGRPAAVEARTGGGGIIARIPAGVPTGPAEVEVSHPQGRGSKSIDVMRYAFVVQPNEGKLHVITRRAGSAPALATTLDMPGLQSVAYSPDGQAAYALLQAAGEETAGGVAIIVTTAGGGPKVVRRLRLPMKQPMFLEVAADAPLMAIVDANAGLLVDLQDPRTPALHEPFALKIGPRGAMPRAVVLDAGGNTLAVLVSEGNQVVPFDVSDAASPRRGTVLVAAPDVRHPVLRAFAYAPAGDQLWAVSGDTELSIAAGQHATEIIPIDVTHGQAAPFSLEPAAPIVGAGAPVVAASSRRQAIAPGTSIRSTTKTAAVVVSTVHPEFLAIANQPAANITPEMLAADAEPGIVLRTDLEGEAQVLLHTSGIATGLAVSHDSTTVAAAVTRIIRTGGAFKLEFGVTFVPLAGGDDQYVRLGDVNLTARLLRPAAVALAP